jgi:hypothetical protein
MGQQGNYPGSGAINQHKYLAMRGQTVNPGPHNQDAHLKEGGSYSEVEGDPNMPRGSGSEGGVTIANSFGESFTTEHRDGNVRGNIP